MQVILAPLSTVTNSLGSLRELRSLAMDQILIVPSLALVANRMSEVLVDFCLGASLSLLLVGWISSGTSRSLIGLIRDACASNRMTEEHSSRPMRKNSNLPESMATAKTSLVINSMEFTRFSNLIHCFRLPELLYLVKGHARCKQDFSLKRNARRRQTFCELCKSELREKLAHKAKEKAKEAIAK